MASFGVLSENGAIVGVWRSLRYGCLAFESRRLRQPCFLFAKNKHFTAYGYSPALADRVIIICIVHLDLLHFTAYQVIFVDIWLAVLYRIGGLSFVASELSM